MTAFYPGLAPIDAYGNSGFRFAGMSHRGSILILPEGIRDWLHASPLELRDFTLVLQAASHPGLLLLGTGKDIVPPAREIRQAFAGRGIGLEVMSTGAAVRTYNVLLAERRSVGAALIAVENT